MNNELLLTIRVFWPSESVDIKEKIKQYILSISLYFWKKYWFCLMYPARTLGPLKPRRETGKLPIFVSIFLSMSHV